MFILAALRVSSNDMRHMQASQEAKLIGKERQPPTRLFVGVAIHTSTRLDRMVQVLKVVQQPETRHRSGEQNYQKAPLLRWSHSNILKMATTYIVYFEFGELLSVLYKTHQFCPIVQHIHVVVHCITDCVQRGRTVIDNVRPNQVMFCYLTPHFLIPVSDSALQYPSL